MISSSGQSQSQWSVAVISDQFLLQTSDFIFQTSDFIFQILNLKNSRTKFLTDVLGSDLFTKYSGDVLKAINPLKSKLGLAALGF